ncbi:MAG: hypothetical protein AAGG59_06700 [Bacteroidota bacterium]
MEDPSLQSYESWNMWAQYIAFILAGLSVLILLSHLIKLAATSDSKTKYDYINRAEINFLMTSAIILIVAGGFFANSNVTELGVLWLFVRVFVTVSMGLIIGVIVQNLLKFYYPFYIEKRLKKLRYKPRISPKTGKPMKLLSEEEEDVYLDEGMQAEEDIFSVDYDVWVDEETGYTKIEKYAGHLHAELSPDSGYYTFKVVKEEIVKPPTYEEEGLLIKYYQDVYSGYKEKRECVIAKLSKSKVEDKVLE